MTNRLHAFMLQFLQKYLEDAMYDLAVVSKRHDTLEKRLQPSQQFRFSSLSIRVYR